MAYTMYHRGLNLVSLLWHHRPLIIIMIKVVYNSNHILCNQFHDRFKAESQGKREISGVSRGGQTFFSSANIAL